MKREIFSAFQDIHADNALKENTRCALRSGLERERRRRVARRAAICAAACCALAVIGGYKLYVTPTSVISIDVNPSVELGVNRFDRVVTVDGLNEDGKALAASLDVLHEKYTDAVDAVLSSDAVTDCLANDGFLSITVVETDEKQGSEILGYVTDCTRGISNAQCYGMQKTEADEAHELGLSYGKYRMYLELREAGADITPEQAASMTMRQLRDLLAQNGTEEKTAELGPASGGGRQWRGGT